MRKLVKYPSVPRPTQRPMPPASGAPLVSVSASSSLPLIDTLTCASSMTSLSVIHSSSAMSAPGLVASVRILLAQPIEFPVRIGEVLDRALVARRGRICLSSIERTQIDRLEARLGVDDAVRQADERSRVRESLSVQTAQDVNLDRTVLEIGGDEHIRRHVDQDAGRALVGLIGE